MKKVLAIDIGASSGRAILGTYCNGEIKMQEIYRFANEPVTVCSHTYWDILRLFHEVKHSIKIAGDIDSIGIDTWGVDYGLINKQGQLIMNPYHYRDVRNDNAEKLDIYMHTGIQFMQFNTVYQLQKEDLSLVDKILLIPDLLAYFLTGEMRMEYTNASTTNLLNAYTHNLDSDVFEAAGISKDIIPPMIKPGETYGLLSQEICDELNVNPVPVKAVGSHDTASAVASVPRLDDEDFVYISSGTWSLFGTLCDRPILNNLSEKLNFTNELAVDFRIRFLKNIMGLWLMQQIRSEYGITFTELSQSAQSAEPFRYLIDPDSNVFLGIGNMSQRINEYLEAELSLPEITRCIYDSLALKYRFTLDKLQVLTGKEYNKIYIFGGGVKDGLLCQFTANACGIPVIACSSEATALGNIAVQTAESISDIPKIMRNSVQTKVYQPIDRYEWQQAYLKAKSIFE